MGTRAGKPVSEMEDLTLAGSTCRTRASILRWLTLTGSCPYTSSRCCSSAVNVSTLSLQDATRVGLWHRFGE